MNQTYLYIYIIGILLAIAVISHLPNKSPIKHLTKHLYHYRKKEYLISKPEHEFFNKLITAIGEQYYIFVQVHPSTFLEHRIKGQYWKAAFSHVNDKSIDFLLCDKEKISPILAIELKDKTHEQEIRKARDTEVERICKEAGMPILWIENHGSFDVEDIRQKIKEKATTVKKGTDHQTKVLVVNY